MLKIQYKKKLKLNFCIKRILDDHFYVGQQVLL